MTVAPANQNVQRPYARPVQTWGAILKRLPEPRNRRTVQTHRRQPISSQDTFSYDVSADGQKFLIATQVEESSVAPLTVLLNWASEMEK